MGTFSSYARQSKEGSASYTNRPTYSGGSRYDESKYASRRASLSSRASGQSAGSWSSAPRSSSYRRSSGGAGSSSKSWGSGLSGWISSWFGGKRAGGGTLGTRGATGRQYEKSRRYE